MIWAFIAAACLGAATPAFWDWSKRVPVIGVLALSLRLGQSAIHRSESRSGAKRHEGMGFHEGWNICIQQLIEVVSCSEADARLTITICRGGICRGGSAHAGNPQ